MLEQSVGEVIATITPLIEAFPDGYVAFDADGTLWSGDIGEDLFDAAIEADVFRPPARAAIELEAHKLGIRPGPTTCDTARALRAAYNEGVYLEERYLELHAWCLAGATKAEVLTFAKGVVEQTALRDRLHPEAVSTLEGLRAANADVFIVSASPRGMVEAAATLVGVGPDRIVAATAIDDGFRLSPDVHRPIPYAGGKVLGLQAVSKGTFLAAFGDNHFDGAMLRAAKVAVAVRPKPKLRESAAEIPGIVELVRG